MALTPLASALIGGSPGSFYTGCTSEATNEALILGYSTSFIHRYNLTTFTETSNSSVGTNACGVALISAASAVVVSSTAGQLQFYEISSDYVQAISASNAVQGYNQVIAGDLLTNTCMYFNGGTRTIFKVNNFAQTSITLNLSAGSDGPINCIINKSSGRWLLGMQGGAVYEIDNNGNVLNKLILSLDNTSGGNYFETTTAVTNLAIANMAYDNNILLLGCGDGTCLVYDYTTGTKLYQYQMYANSQLHGIILSNAASGEVIGFDNGTASDPGFSIYEMDFTVKPLKFYDSVYTNSAGAPQAIGVNNQTSVGWWTQADASSNPRIYFFRMSGVRATTTQTFTVQVGGVDQKARLLLLDDTTGNTVGRPLLDTYMQSPATYRVPTGKTIKAVVKVGEGEDAVWQANGFTT